MSLETCLETLGQYNCDFEDAANTALEVRSLYCQGGVEYSNSVRPTVRLVMVAHDLEGELF